MTSYSAYTLPLDTNIGGIFLMEQNSFGRHYLVELIDCQEDKISFAGMVEQALIDAVKASGATYISHQTHQFSPHGVSVVVMIAESHMTVHTWPESKYAAIDIFTCGEKMSAEAALQVLMDRFGASECKQKEIARGF